jgi:hypothetical protein
LIPKEGKMTNIFSSDVQTYVRELISKEFGSVNNEEKTPSENIQIHTISHSEGMAAVNAARDKKT